MPHAPVRAPPSPALPPSFPRPFPFSCLPDPFLRVDVCSPVPPFADGRPSPACVPAAPCLPRSLPSCASLLTSTMTQSHEAALSCRPTGKFPGRCLQEFRPSRAAGGRLQYRWVPQDSQPCRSAMRVLVSSAGVLGTLPAAYCRRPLASRRPSRPRPEIPFIQVISKVIQFILKVILPCSQLASDLACPLFDTVTVVAARRSSRVGRLAP